MPTPKFKMQGDFFGARTFIVLTIKAFTIAPITSHRTMNQNYAQGDLKLLLASSICEPPTMLLDKYDCQASTENFISLISDWIWSLLNHFSSQWDLEVLTVRPWHYTRNSESHGEIVRVGRYVSVKCGRARDQAKKFKSPGISGYSV